VHAQHRATPACLAEDMSPTTTTAIGRTAVDAPTVTTTP
jgi:hypothetical protein